MRVTLAPFEEAMISDAYIGWLNDKTLMRFSRNAMRDHTRETCLEYLASFNGTQNLFFGIFEHAGFGLVGTLTVYMEPDCTSGDVGILVGRPDARGQGVGGRAWAQAIDYLFEAAGVETVTAGTDHRNLPMVGIMERSGMQFLRTAPGDLPNDPQSRVVLYALTRAQWIDRNDRRVTEG